MLVIDNSIQSNLSKLLFITMLFAVVTATAENSYAQKSNIPDMISYGSNSIDSLAKESDIRERLVTVTFRDITLEDAINEIAQSVGLKLTYSKNIVPIDRKIDSLRIVRTRVNEALNMVLKGTKLIAIIKANGQGVIALIQSNNAIPSKNNEKMQDRAIRGRVIDSVRKIGLPGVVISRVGSDRKTVTDQKGEFEIIASPNSNTDLSFKMLGYISKQKSIRSLTGNNAIQIIEMVASATSLNEVVTTATGSQRRVEIGNDIVKLNASEILEKAPARSVSDMLRYAQVPGVSVQTASGEPGAPTKVRIRGIGSISQNTDPAVIVDGIWVNSRMSDNSIENNAWGNGSSIGKKAYVSSPLDNIDPLSIETIEIVKGPSAASLYGQEAANGVIVITTKRGKSGPASWTYSYSRDWDGQTRRGHGNWYGYGTDQTGGLYNGSCTAERQYSLACSQDSVVNLNSFGNLFDKTGPGSLSNYSAAVRGGIGSLNYSLSGSYRDNLGTGRIPRLDLIRSRILNVDLPEELNHPSRLKTISVNSTIGFNAAKRLLVTLVASASNSRQNLADLNIVNAGVADSIINNSRMVTVLGGSNSLNVKSSVSGRLEITEGWNATGTLGVDIGERRDNGKNEYRQCSYPKCDPMVPSKNDDRLKQSSISTKLLTGRLSTSRGFSTRFDRILSVTPSFGLDVKRDIGNQARVSLWDVPFGSDNGYGNGAVTISGNDVISAGYYVNGAFKVLDRMYFDLGFRQDAGSVIKMDGSSRYPKFATSWLVSEEDFFPANNFLDFLKLRGSIGYAAVHPTEADLYGKYTYQRSSIDGQIHAIASLDGIGNNRLVPERSLEIEGGFDANFLNDRAELIFTMAHKVLRNAIVNRRLPTSSGMLSGSRKENISKVLNRSVEIGIVGRIIDNDWALVQLGANVYNINNVIKKLGDRVSIVDNTEINRLVEGYHIGSVWEKPLLGYSDINGNGIIEATEIVVGDTTVFKGWNTPKFTAGYTASVSILNRNLTASIALSQIGDRIQYATFVDNYGEVVVGAPLESQVLNLISSRNKGAAMNVSELRINSASINYNLPRDIAKRLNTKLIAVSLQGSNLALWTDYKGRDPMVNSTPIGNVMQDDGFTLPMPRKYAFNIRVEL